MKIINDSWSTKDTTIKMTYVRENFKKRSIIISIRVLIRYIKFPPTTFQMYYIQMEWTLSF